MKLEKLHKDSFYHIYNRGINGENIFVSSENKQYFLKLLGNYVVDVASVYSYCLMDNHYHLLIQLNDDGDKVTQRLSNFFNAYAKAFNKANNRTGSLFEKHFRRIKISGEDYLKHLIVYIHLNPFHHFGIDFKSFPYSSYKSFLNDQPTKINRQEVVSLFGSLDNFIFIHDQKKDVIDEKYKLE